MLTAFVGFAQKTKSVKKTHGIDVGEIVTPFSAQDQHDSTFVLVDALAKGPVVVVFYRGQWCPYCNRHLSELQDNLNQIEEKGATIVAISPENQEALGKTVEKTGAQFTLLFDENYEICKDFDVLFVPTNAQIAKYDSFLNADLWNAHSNETVLLPVPATFIIDQTGVIIWRQFDQNYKERSTIEEILKQLEL
jgi:peroxiredoxin